MINKGLFSSASQHWSTPVDLYKELDSEFHFNDDPCPLYGSGGLNREWGTRTFCNPPYGRETIKWVTKAYEEAKKGKTIVMLLASRTDVEWFHKYILPFNINLNRIPHAEWAAGIIDGEGCIFIKRDNPTVTSRHKSPIYTIGLKVTMTHRKTIYTLQELFHRGHITVPKRFDGIKQPYSWVVRSNQAAYVLNQIYPFLLTKKQEAFKALEFSTLKSDRNGQKRTTQLSLDRKADFYNCLRDLKGYQTTIPIINTEIRFLRGRLKFGNSKNSAPFPSAIAIFGKGDQA